MTCKKILKLSIVFISFSIVNRLLSNVCSAEGIGLSIDPPVFEAIIKPGKTVTQIFTIQNLSESPRMVVAKIVPFIPESDTGFPILKPNLEPSWLNYFSLANSFIKFSTPFELQAGQKEQLILSISVPSDSSLTDRYATLLITTNLDQDNESSGSSKTMFTTTIGANILLSTSDTANPPTLVRIKDFAPVEKDILFHYGNIYFVDNLSPIAFQASSENLGKYLTKTAGLIRVSKNNSVISLQSLIPLNLLSNSSRTLQGSPSGEILFQPEFTDIGSHKVEIDIRSDNSSSHAEITLILVPLKVGLGLFIGIILLSTIIKISARNKKD